MSKKYLVSLDLSKNELLNARIQNLASAPSTPVTGQVYYDTALGKFGSFNGTTWDYMGTSTATGDVSSNTAVSVDSELVIFSGTTGKTVKRATQTGLAKLTAGVLSTGTAGTDYSAGTNALGTGILKSTTTTGALTIAVAGDFPTLNQSTTGSAATLTTLRSIYGNNFDGSAALTQIISSAYGGTGNGWTKFTGPTTSEKTFTLPDASATILTSAAAVTVAQGGTGNTTATTAYGLQTAGTTATGVHQTVAPGTAGWILKSGGAAALPAFAAGAPGDVGLSNVTNNAQYYPGGTDVAIADGGTGASTAALARTALGLLIGTDVLAPAGNGSALTGITESQVSGLVTDLGLKAPLASPTFTGTVTVPTPTNGTDAANKLYVDNAVQGLTWKSAVRVATAAAGTLASSFANASVVDGITLATNDRILIKNQATGSENGIYIVNATGAPTRATDADTSAEINGATIYVMSGTANADTAWTLTTDSVILGTTAQVWAQINGGALATASTSVAGKVQLATQAEAQAKSDAAKALTAASVADFARKFTGTIGDGASTAIAVTHGLGTQYVTAQVYDATSNLQVECDVTLTSGTQTSFTFAIAPTSNQYRVVITG